ncbi:DUF3194 domain-containing protein [Thermococcus sp.]|uniref:DUF3194 domain-containing protein n=1 Tax=Thermococcus sp. TaxID=35749 RepID=UPI0026352240|nr:DUF3194 domain-containing protein [Thermococcus sp.]
MGGDGRRIVHIGLPELSEDELVAIGDLAQETILQCIFNELTRSEVKDIEVTTRINRNETLDLEVEVYLEVPVFLKADPDALVDKAIERAYEVVEKRLKELAAKD